MKPIAILFALATIICAFGTGNLSQINSIANATYTSTGLPHWITGLCLAVILALVILGGIRRIAAVTEKLVPSMALIYMFGAFAVIFWNYDQILPGSARYVLASFYW